MPENLLGPWLTASIVIPLAAAGITKWFAAERYAHRIGIGACAASLLLTLESVRELVSAGWSDLREPLMPTLFQADALNAVTMVLFAAIALVTLVSAPRRDAGREFVSGALALVGCVLAAYASGSIAVFTAAWIGCTVTTQKRDTAFSLLTGLMLATVAFLELPEPIAFGLLTLAAIMRSGIFPFQSLALGRFTSGSLTLAGLSMNAQLGAFLMIRFALPLFPTAAPMALPWLCILALTTTIYTAIRAMTEREPRRLLGLIFISQSSAILAGLLTARPEGTTGALLQWIVLTIASTMMIAIYRAIEVRVGQSLNGEVWCGLAGQMPRMAVFFAIAALTLVGLPGTLGFPGEDLLIHGVLSAHPWIGMALPAAIALNAYHLYRLFSRLFLGAPVRAWSTPSTFDLDALPRERWALVACLLLLLWGGWLPAQVVALRSHAADVLAADYIASGRGH